MDDIHDAIISHIQARLNMDIHKQIILRIPLIQVIGVSFSSDKKKNKRIRREFQFKKNAFYFINSSNYDMI